MPKQNTLRLILGDQLNERHCWFQKMESFFRLMRKRYDILMDGKKPVGDQWNFDQKNRHPYDGKVPVPEPLLFENNVSAIYKTIRKEKVATIGEIKADRLIWPVSRDQALKLLKSFLTHFLPAFGA